MSPLARGSVWFGPFVALVASLGLSLVACEESAGHEHGGAHPGPAKQIHEPTPHGLAPDEGEDGASPAAHEHHTAHHSFAGAEKWAERFEAPDRDEWQKPEVVIAALAIDPAARIADIGSATGYFPVRFAAAAPQGRVWGIDIEPDMVRYLNQRARTSGIDNLFSIHAVPDDPLLPEPVDLVTIIDTVHHIEARPVYFAKLKAALRPGGRVAIIDFRMGELPVGPPDSAKVPASVIRAEMEQAGLRVVEEIDVLPHQYFTIFAPRESGTDAKAPAEPGDATP